MSPDTIQLALAIIAGLIAIAVIWQAIETRRAAQAARDSVEGIKHQAGIIERQTKAAENTAIAARENASAAKLSAEAIINSERSWVLTEMKKEGPEIFLLKFWNRGKTPAEIIDVKQKDAWTEPLTTDKRDLPVPPSYGSETKLVQPRVIPPGGSFVYDAANLGTILPANVYEDIRKTRRKFFIYGWVQYRDLIDRSKVRETGYCYFWSPATEEFIIGGPPEYTYYT